MAYRRSMALSGAGRALVVVMTLVGSAATSAAQGIEIVPFGGYRVGTAGAAGHPFKPIVFDAGGGVSFGAIVDMTYGPPQDGLKFEVLFSHERSWIEVDTASLFDQPERVDVTIDHLMLGGVQELDTAPGRAFIGGLVGLSRYAAPDEVDIRFTIGLSAGAKFYANRHVGVRLDARGYMTILSLSGAAVCSGGCTVAFNINPAFQADFTAGLIIAF